MWLIGVAFGSTTPPGVSPSPPLAPATGQCRPFKNASKSSLPDLPDLSLRLFSSVSSLSPHHPNFALPSFSIFLCSSLPPLISFGVGMP